MTLDVDAIEIGFKITDADYAELADATRARAEKLIAEVRQLQEHVGEAPSLDRIKEAHSWMARDSWIEPDGVGHRVYCQNMDEQCYLCAVIVLLDKADVENKRLRDGLQDLLGLVPQMQRLEEIPNIAGTDIIKSDD